MKSNSKEAVEARKQAWVQRLQAELNRMLDLLRQRADVEKVIVAGSMARGDAGVHSDLDVVVIQKTDKRFLDRLGDFYSYLCPTVETDILVYTPQEWEELALSRGFFRRLHREGVVMYEAKP
jgi:predicted nucleotidyltransferase